MADSTVYGYSEKRLDAGLSILREKDERYHAHARGSAAIAINSTRNERKSGALPADTAADAGYRNRMTGSGSQSDSPANMRVAILTVLIK